MPQTTYATRLKNLFRSAVPYIDSALFSHYWKIFFASPTRGDQEALGTIRSVLNDYDDLEVVDWRDVHQNAGNVARDVFGRMSECDSGVCYFSEPNPEGDRPAYIDNLNVSFEAGLLQGQGPGPLADVLNWIPIRERDSVDIPYDFSNIPVLEVPRGTGGQVDTERLEKLLRERVDLLLKQFRNR